MGFLGQAPKPINENEQFKFSESISVNAMAHEIMNIEHIMEDHIEVYDIAFQIRYHKKMTQHNSDNYRMIANKELPVPEPLRVQLMKLMDARIKSELSTPQQPKQKRMQQTGEVRPIHEIAHEIIDEWAKCRISSAWPYLQAMKQLDKIEDKYGADSAEEIIRYFLNNAETWKGKIARQTKRELLNLLRTAK